MNSLERTNKMIKIQETIDRIKDRADVYMGIINAARTESPEFDLIVEYRLLQTKAIDALTTKDIARKQELKQYFNKKIA